MEALANPRPDHSSLIASKLLQGWTLLADSCPVCLTPLVRNRQKQVFCVSCSQWLLTEDQLALKLQEHHVHDFNSAPNHNHMRVASQRDDAPSPDEPSPKRQLASTEPLSGVLSEDTTMAAPPPDSGLLDQSPSNLPKVEGTLVLRDVLTNTLATLCQKLEEIRQAIAACQNTGELHQLFNALSECMQGIEKAQGLIDNYAGREAAAEASKNRRPVQTW